MAARTEVLDALGDPTRRAILDLLRREGSRSVREIADALPVTRSAVSQHLRVLKDARLVRDEPRGTRRFYSLAPEGLADARAYLELFWQHALASLKDAAEASETNAGA
ncbi:MAG TPA: metalloregulator ArsR/SmtB family transcription factor [Gaiellaceae bacterium]|nr:metalloregulator ArsR/SmtB family transcription factor [Gaiellaceae bacterium]